MADEKNTPAPVLDVVNQPAALAPDVAPDMAPEKSRVVADTVSVFEPDTFLAGKKSEGKKGDVASKPPTQIVKSGGVGFVTALLMSTIAAGAGAYLALLAGSRPDLLQRAGIAAFVPAPPLAPSLGTSSANLEPLAARVSALEAEILSLNTRLDSTAPPSVPSATVAQKAPAIAGKTPLALPATPSQSPSAVAAAPADTSALDAQLQGIGGRVTAIETRLAALDPTGAGGAIVAGLQADIAGLKAIVATLQQQASSAPSPAATFAVVNLAEAANRAGPFMIEYETVRAAMPGVAEVAALEPFARTGVATRQLLAERFVALKEAETVQSAAFAEASKDTGIVAWFRGLFADMIKVQPAATTAGSSSTAVLARAKAKLDQGDLLGCIGELGTIKAPSTTLTEWTVSARQRVELESRVSALRGAVGRAPTVAPIVEPAGKVASPALTPLSAPPAPIVTPSTKVAPTTVQGTNP